MSLRTGHLTVIVLVTIILLMTTFVRSLSAQQATVSTPAPVVGHSFHENIGLTWGMRGNGWFFNSGGLAPPPFGGGGGGGGANFGFGGFRLTAEQGSSTTMSSQSPSVTVMNGGTGYFSDTTIRPFVTGLIPVVGNMPTAPLMPSLQANPINPVLQRLDRLQAEGRLAVPKAAADREAGEAGAEEPKRLVFGGKPAVGGPGSGPSSAERGDLSVAEIKARRTAAATDGDEEVAGYIVKAEAALADGKPGVARVYFQMAARRTSGPQQRELLARLSALEPTR